MKLQNRFTPGRTLLVAGVFEVTLLLVALVAGRFAKVDPLASLTADGFALFVGLAAIVPMTGLLWWGLNHPDNPIARPTFEARDFVAVFFAGMRWPGFAVVSVLAGVCEEALFRGLLQTLITQHSNAFAGLLAASLLFGLAHAVSIAYVLVATIIGVYLGVLYQFTGSLTAPIVCHAAYDFVALICLSRSGRGR